MERGRWILKRKSSLAGVYGHCISIGSQLRWSEWVWDVYRFEMYQIPCMYE
jgi:hypothetical protein